MDMGEEQQQEHNWKGTQFPFLSNKISGTQQNNGGTRVSSLKFSLYMYGLGLILGFYFGLVKYRIHLCVWAGR